MSGKITPVKLVLGWWVIATVLLACFFFPYFGEETDYIYKILLTLNGSAVVLALITYETKIQVSLPLLFIAELSAVGAVLKETEVFTLNTEIILATIGVFTSIYIAIGYLKKNNKKITFNNYIQANIKPYDVPKLFKIILLICIISTVFSMANTLRLVEPNATLMSIIYILMPTFIMLLSVIPIKETTYLRAIYYIIWITFIQMGTDIQMLSIITMIQPIVYLITLIFGRIYLLGNTDESELNVRFRKNIKKN